MVGARVSLQEIKISQKAITLKVFGLGEGLIRTSFHTEGSDEHG